MDMGCEFCLAAAFAGNSHPLEHLGEIAGGWSVCVCPACGLHWQSYGSEMRPLTPMEWTQLSPLIHRH